MLNIYCGKTLFDGYEPLMNRLMQNRKAKLFASHIFVVPDRFSMACEKDIFDYLGIESTFDIRVLTLTRFASEVLGAGVSTLSKGVSAMIIQRLLIVNKSKLKCFSKTKLSNSFASEIYETINQLKSCNVKPDDIVIEGDDFLATKMQDIKLIYKEYEKYLSDNALVDSADKFTLFEKYLPNAKNLKDSAIYISHFDSFTRQGYAIIKKFITYAGQVNISLAKAGSGLNSHIYLNDVYANVISIADSLGVKPNILEVESKLGASFEHIKSNLFAYKPQEKYIKSNDITLSCHATFLAECEYVATAIKKLTTAGVRYRDIAVAVPSLENRQNTIKKVFDDFEFNTFFDTSVTLSGSVVHKLITTLFNLKARYFRSEDIIKLIKNPILDLDEDFVFTLENYIKTKLIEGKSIFRQIELLNNFRDSAGVYFDFLDNLSKVKTYDGYISLFEKFFEDISLESRLNEMVGEYLSKGYTSEAKRLEQVYPKVSALFTCIKDIFAGIECSLFELYDVISSGFEGSKISITPVSVDGVFVGDASKSLFERVKYLFVMGAKEGDLPLVSSDCGMITDKEIDRLSSFYKLEPSIATINLRERFKLFNTLLLPKTALHISYSKDKNASPSNFVNFIRSMFVFEGRNGKQNIEMLNDDYNYFDKLEKFGSRRHAEKLASLYLRNIEDGINYTDKEIGSLVSAVQKVKPYLKDYKSLTSYKRNTKTLKNMFFRKGTISVSEVEKYYDCPFKHYVEYGLKLKENKQDSFDNIEVGNFLHKVAEIFVKENMKSFPFESDTKGIVKDIFDRVLDSEEFSKIKDSENNKLSIISIEKEAYRMCDAINYQIKKSSFRPIFTEARFDAYGKIKSLDIKVGNSTLKIVGAIDRIDACEEYFRIIDYKTGRCDSSLKELYFGKKLQLYVYQNVVQNSLKLKPAGAYYFPVKNKFTDEGKNAYSAYKLKGYTENSDKVLTLSDSDFEKENTSTILNVIKNKDGQVSKRSHVLDSEGVLLLADYALKSLSKGASEIMEGNITPSPFVNDGDSACKYCAYRSICRFDEVLGDSERKDSGTVSIDIIKEGVNGD